MVPNVSVYWPVARIEVCQWQVKRSVQLQMHPGPINVLSTYPCLLSWHCGTKAAHGKKSRAVCGPKRACHSYGRKAAYGKYGSRCISF